MRLKRLITGGLLLFVVFSLAVIIWQETSTPPVADHVSVSQALPPVTSVPSATTLATVPPATSASAATSVASATSVDSGALRAPAPSVPPAEPDQSVPGNETSAEAQAQSIVLKVFYFHGNARCYTCNMIENMTRQAVQTGFSEMVSRGTVMFEVINVQQAGNEHFIHQYQLVSPMVVVARYVKGEQTHWKKLEQVWHLVHQGESVFFPYIQNEISSAQGDNT